MASSSHPSRGSRGKTVAVERNASPSGWISDNTARESKILSLNQIDLTGEIKITCNKTNEIGKATLTCIGLKKTVLGWIFSDFEKTSKRAIKLKKSLMRMNEKMDEIIKNYEESSTSTEESTDEDDESSEKRILWKYLNQNRVIGLHVLESYGYSLEFLVDVF
ncbi:hypothetical protein LR48_Vigan07g101800 [Vigna angularis]|uniref:Uncharacterized protein n=1 Tax=Phaseolus angularis TaxID=3914 RepID=A0A0L9UXN5_PHAAN|nr:hypothetical protein LR48_Vigan07g101800 [Vigna angularis]